MTAPAIELLAQRGWPVFPCAVMGKTPLVKRWPQVASSNIPTLRDWSAYYPGCNWAVMTGAEAGVFVVDVDGAKGTASQNALEDQHGKLPASLTCTTGRGKHIYFRYPDDLGTEIRSSANRLGLKLDVRGNGGYVIVPPSMHSTGTPYQWVNPHQEIADAPAWLIEKLRDDARAEHGTMPARFGILIQGSRNDGLFRFACALRRKGRGEGAIAQELSRKNQRHCKPPLAPEELAQIATSAAGYEAGGLDPLMAAWNAIDADSIPSPYQQFLALAKSLQSERRNYPIALPLERIAALMGHRDWTQVRRWRKRAVREGWLQPIERSLWVCGKPGKAATYKFNELQIGVPLALRCPIKSVKEKRLNGTPTLANGTPTLANGTPTLANGTLHALPAAEPEYMEGML